MKKILKCNYATVERETKTIVYVRGKPYTSFRLGDTEKVNVSNLEMYLVNP